MTRIALVTLSVFTLASAALAEETITGQWMIDPFPIEGKVQLTLHRGSEHSQMTSSSALGLDQLRGLARAQMDASSGTNVHFEIARNAGTLACEGFFRSGKGAGTFTFSPSTSFVGEMRSLGYDSLSTEMVFSMAVHDVTTQYVRDMRSLGVQPHSSEQLITMRIHKVSVDYVRELKGLGFNDLSADRLVTMRIHGVTPDFITHLQSRGMKNLTVDQLVSLRIHGID